MAPGHARLQSWLQSTTTRVVVAAKLLIGLEAPSGFEPEMEVLQTSALPLGYGARPDSGGSLPEGAGKGPPALARGVAGCSEGGKVGAGNGIRTRDFDLGKVALYH